jgi:putative transposase
MSRTVPGHATAGCRRRVRTTMGAVELQRPKLRGTDEAFCSRLFGAGVTRINALESLVISGWVRGLSDRDIEAALAEVLGAEAALSKSTVSRICQRLRTEIDAWKTRDVSGVRLDHLFVDGSHFKMHPGAPPEPVLAAWGIATDGRRRSSASPPRRPSRPTPGATSSPTSSPAGWGRRCSASATAAPGLCGAFDRTFPTNLRQRCLIHRARNVLAKVTEHDQAAVKATSVLVRSSGRSMSEVARSLGIAEGTLWNWVRTAREADSRRSDPDALTGSERNELRRLRKENIELRADAEILRRAAAYFARETMR